MDYLQQGKLVKNQKGGNNLVDVNSFSYWKSRLCPDNEHAGHPDLLGLFRMDLDWETCGK
jgi:hypothetical protein